MGREILGLFIVVAAVWGGGLFIIFILNYALFSIKTYLCGYLSLISRLVSKKKQNGKTGPKDYKMHPSTLQGYGGEGSFLMTPWYIE